MAREAAALGCRAAAISQYVTKNAEVDWAVTRHHAARVIRVLMDTDLTTPSAWFWNVNLPHPLTLDDQPEFRFRDLDPSPHRFTYRREAEKQRHQTASSNPKRDSG